MEDLKFTINLKIKSYKTITIYLFIFLNIFTKGENSTKMHQITLTSLKLKTNPKFYTKRSRKSNQRKNKPKNV